MGQTIKTKRGQVTENKVFDLEQSSEQPGRRRSPTMLKMELLAERVRKLEKIRKKIELNCYNPDSRDIAMAMLGIEES